MMTNGSGRRLKKRVAVFFMALGFVVGGIVLGLTADRLLSLLTPQSLLRAAMPMLYGVDVPDNYERMQTELDANEHGEGEVPDEAKKGKPEIQFELMNPEEGVSDKIRIELMGASRNETIDLSGEKPRVLIYHTHATEAYTPTKQFPYDALFNEERTDQNDRNIVAVGTKLAEILSKEYGISVLHVTTNFEPPKLGYAYDRSIVMMEKMLKEHPTIELFIDVHRDAWEREEGAQNEEGRDYVVIDGEKVARLMFVVGTGEGKTGVGFKIKPNYKQNYALALSITEKLDAYQKGLVKPIRVKTARYNQHIKGKALLVEVGHNANTLEEALNAVPYLAKAIAKSAGIESKN